MKKITPEQMDKMFEDLNKFPEPSTIGGIKFEFIHPWSSEAWQLHGDVHEADQNGLHYGAPILASKHDVEMEYYRNTSKVYQQFVFTGQSPDLYISMNLNNWLEEHHVNTTHPPIRMTGVVHDLGDAILPAGSYLIENTFIVHKIKEDITLKEYIQKSVIGTGDIIRLIEYNPETKEIKKLLPSVMYHSVTSELTPVFLGVA